MNDDEVKIDEEEVKMASEGGAVPIEGDTHELVPCDPAENAFEAGTGELILVRQGHCTDIKFPFRCPATVGRFDPSVGPIDIDLGDLQPEGAYISRKHAKITFEDGVYMLVDLESSNGCFILRDDFEKVEAAELADGNQISFGNARFQVKLG